MLDQQLKGIVESLSSAFIEYLLEWKVSYSRDANEYASLGKLPLPRAISIILSVLCKVRGQKVIVQLLNNEAKNMEPMLDALEIWAYTTDCRINAVTDGHGMIWQERYIMLLWLSHFMLAPFDLVTMASDNIGTGPNVSSISQDLIENVPSIARRIVHVCVYYLDFASKERETASILLARLALRRDILWMGLQKKLINWALSSLDGTGGASASTSTHALIGILSFLSRFIVSADKVTLQPLLRQIYKAIERAQMPSSPCQNHIASSAIARKHIIKITRSLAVTNIKIEASTFSCESALEEGTMEEVIDQLITSLEYNDTSVRVAASKALSVVALQFDVELVEQIAEAVFDKLGEDVLYDEAENGPLVPASNLITQDQPLHSQLKPSMDNLNISKWHGLILTVSQMIYHNSLPLSLTGRALKALSLALVFEQRGSSGAANGTNVRDAACFGLWASARRRTMDDLSEHSHNQSIFQKIAVELVVAATLDPAGNIRRGASASLQELIGRHPDTVAHGLQLVQIVDYNSIALRSRAMSEVALEASKTDPMYWNAILDGLLGWRGIDSPDARSRRHAAKTVGLLAICHGLLGKPLITITAVREKYRIDNGSNIHQRHGVILTMAEILLATTEHLSELAITFEISRLAEFMVDIRLVSRSQESGTLYHSPLIAEATCFLLSAVAIVYSKVNNLPPLTAPELRSYVEVLNASLHHQDLDVVDRIKKAARGIFTLLDTRTQGEVVWEWTERLRSFGSKLQRKAASGVIAALGAVFTQTNLHTVSTLPLGITRSLEDCGYPGTADTLPPLSEYIIGALIDHLTETSDIDVKFSILITIAKNVLASGGTISYPFLFYP